MLYFKIKSKVILAFIILITKDLIKELLLIRFILFIKYIVLSEIKYSIYLTLIPLIIKLRLKSAILMLNVKYKGFKALNSLIKLLVKVLKSLFYTFILKLLKESFI
jgi:hypothetical protein